MKKIVALFLVLVLTASNAGAVSTALPEGEIRKCMLNYFEMKYKVLSTLTYDDAVKEYIAPEVINAAEVMNEADTLEMIIKFRKGQINDLRFDKFKYDIEFLSIVGEGETIRVSLIEKYELYFKCAPTVRNSGKIEHLVTIKQSDGKWQVLNDEYADMDGIKAKLRKYFIEEGLSKSEAKKRVLDESKTQSTTRLKHLEALLKNQKDKRLLIFFAGKNISYVNGTAIRIDNLQSTTPKMIGKAMYIPVKFFSEKLGYTVKADINQTVLKISGKGRTILVKASDQAILINNKKSRLSDKPVMSNGIMLLSVKSLSLLFNKKVFSKGSLVILSETVLDVKNSNVLYTKLEEYFDVLFTKADFPRIDGSTATYPLSMEIGKQLLGLDDMSAKGFITHKTTHNAYVNLINKNADIIFVTLPSPEELQLAKENGVELEVVPICKEGFVFLVNKENQVQNLTASQIREIYQGKIRNWREVGGIDSEIIPYQREANSGSQTLMENLVMKGVAMGNPPKEVVVYGMGELIDRVADYSNAKNALGYSVFFYATQMYSTGSIKLLSIDGVIPEKATIKNGKYPFVTSYYAVLRKDEAKNSNARKLLKWILGEEGQGIVDKAGFVKIR